MKKIKRVSGLVLGAAAVGVFLTACSNDDYRGVDGNARDRATIKQIQVDGRVVDCMFIGQYRDRVMSCDWENAKTVSVR